MKVCAMADMHGHLEFYRPAEYCADVGLVVIAGDFACDDEKTDVVVWCNDEFLPWCERWRNPSGALIDICLVPGNHDRFIHKHYHEVKWAKNVHLLIDELFVFHTGDKCNSPAYTIYGTPWCLWDEKKDGNQRVRSQIFEDGRGMLSCQFRKIPEHVDLLISHAPPLGEDGFNTDKCLAELTDRLMTLKHPPKHQVCGHDHGLGGRHCSLKCKTHVRNVAHTIEIFSIR